MKHWMIAAVVMLCTATLSAADSVHAPASTWQPSEGHTQIPIWPGTPPNPIPKPAQESAQTQTGGGVTWTSVTDVSIPTMTVYSPTVANTGVAILVFPGGGYRRLAIDAEGTNVCDVLNQRGITCVLLKYRVPFSGPHNMNSCGCDVYPKFPTALQDAQRTIGLVRQHAAEWHIDPHKVGVLGFSAGGHLVANMSTHYDKRAYKPIDDADKESIRPDFGVPLYPGHLNVTDDSLLLRADIGKHITPAMPPQLLLFNEDDAVDPVEGYVSYYIGLLKAKAPVEIHSYTHGGHAFGVRKSEFAVSDWPDHLLMPWLGTIGMIPK